MTQLDLLTYELSPDEIGDPAMPLPPPVNRHAVIWQQTKADCYLRLMGRFMAGRQCAQVVRRHEIARLHELRQRAIAELEQLTGGNGNG